MGTQVRLHYFARICWNNRAWSEPAGVGALAETGGYVNRRGYGLEEWLFDISKRVDGWHYTYLRPIEKSLNKLRREQRTNLQLSIWTKNPAGDRLQVGEIKECEVLSEEESVSASEEYEERGWFKEMREQIDALGGVASENGLGDAEPWMFNVRFLPEHAQLFEPYVSLPADHFLYRVNRYQLNEVWARPTRRPMRPRRSAGRISSGSTHRRATGAAVVNADHSALQQHILQLLEKQHGKRSVRAEQDWVDIRCQIASETHFIEIKSDPRPRVAIREAVGQLLEYANYYPEQRAAPIRLHIAAPGHSTPEDDEYLDALRDKYDLVLRYHQIDRESKQFKLS